MTNWPQRYPKYDERCEKRDLHLEDLFILSECGNNGNTLNDFYVANYRLLISTHIQTRVNTFCAFISCQAHHYQYQDY